jgi:hypothetical protein
VISDPRLTYALTHPLSGVDDDLAAYQTVTAQPDGNLLLAVLAVDR